MGTSYYFIQEKSMLKGIHTDVFYYAFSGGLNIWKESERSREALFILLKIAPAQPEKG